MGDFLIEPARLATEEEMPTNARRLLLLAREHGFEAHGIYSKAYDPDRGHFGPDGKWDQARVETRPEPVIDPESGQQEMTEPSKRYPQGQPRVRQVPVLVDGEPVKIVREVLTIVFLRREGDEHVFKGLATWERLSGTRTGAWKFDFAVTNDGRGVLTSKQVTDYLKEH